MRGNVAFTSAQSGWSFTLQSFAKLYADVFGAAFDTNEFARRLWGDVYFHPDSEHHNKSFPEISTLHSVEIGTRKCQQQWHY